MSNRIRFLWANLEGAYWFLPGTMLVLSILLSFATISLDHRVRFDLLKTIPWIYLGGPEGARTVLSTIAGSTITVTGVIFSTVIVALSIASSQFGPRLLTNFMRDNSNQAVLGTFLGTFIYCLLVLRTIRSSGESAAFVPYISVTLGILLAIASMVSFVYFVHHVSISINADYLVDLVAHDLERAIERSYPSSAEDHSHPRRQGTNLPADFEEAAGRIPSDSSGYLRAVNYPALVHTAQDRDMVLKLLYRPGQFIQREETIIRYSPGVSLTEEDFGDFQRELILGPERVGAQDVEAAIYQLVELAVRSLSPAINDPFTAMSCIDRLAASLSILAGRPIPSAFWYDDQGALRLVAEQATFPQLLAVAFNQVREEARDSTAVTIRMLEALSLIAAHVRSPVDGQAVLQQAAMIKREAEKFITEPWDRERIEQKYQMVTKILERQEPAALERR